MGAPGVNPVPVALTERSREYVFPAGNVKLENVTELLVSATGNHRLKTADGKLHIVAPGWLAVHVDDGGKGWTV